MKFSDRQPPYTPLLGLRFPVRLLVPGNNYFGIDTSLVCDQINKFVLKKMLYESEDKRIGLVRLNM